ncbi:60S ribosomal protein L19-1 isoform X2 [Capsella rubella]|uniref:60S ribosomal protein L19-1 isoform X2 n=1 Tax=Capsella rubella TaxID=81985 RepID=UPI000CD531E9|nr:60S ribosomal protein L19-1 isoform X2 [Capsella rubella]
MAPMNFHLRSRARRKYHQPAGKSAMEAMPRKMKYLMRRLKMLKRLLKRLYQDEKMYDKHVYHDMFMKVKGKRVLIESMHKFSREKRFASSCEKRLAQQPEGEEAAPVPAP